MLSLGHCNGDGWFSSVCAISFCMSHIITPTKQYSGMIGSLVSGMYCVDVRKGIYGTLVIFGSRMIRGVESKP